MPWPEYPCHGCTDEEAHRRGPLLMCTDGLPFYSESDGYYWHTAGWNRTTGRWYAVCCFGHRKKGRQAA